MRVTVAHEDPGQMADKRDPDDADALLVPACLDPAFASTLHSVDHLASWVTDAIMILAAPGATVSRMRLSRRLLRRTGVSLRSVILLGSDGADDTLGVLSPPVEHLPVPVESSASSG